MSLGILKIASFGWAAGGIAVVASGPSRSRAGRGVGGQLEIKVVDHDTGEPLACRIHLTNQAGRVQKPPKVPFWHDHFVIDGSLTLKLPKGIFNFVVERGPEYLNVTGHFEILDNAQDKKTIKLRRFVDMSKEGWWSGDLEVERPQKELDLLMRADDLHVGRTGTDLGQPQRFEQDCPAAVSRSRKPSRREAAGRRSPTSSVYHSLAGSSEPAGWQPAGPRP